MEIKKGSAAKRHRQSVQARLHNRIIRSQIRTATKQFLQTVDTEDQEKMAAQFRVVQKLLDTAGSKKIYHKNNIARKKSRLSKYLKKTA